MRDVAIIGVGAHPTGRFPEKPLKALAHTAIRDALTDAGISAREVECAYFANSLGGSLTGQEGIRGQVVLQYSGITGIPVINVENACSSASTAFRGAWLEVASGAADVAIAVGAEKMFVGDSARTIAALAAVSELDLARMGMQFTTSYAIHPKINLKGKMRDYGWTMEDLAKPAVKNSANGALNPIAQHRKPLTIEQIVQSRPVVDPLTLLMCSSISDGAAAAVLCATDLVARFTSRNPIGVSACVLRSGVYKLPNGEQPDSATVTARAAYEQAGIGPEDIGAIELHDAMAPAELMLYERLGLCDPGDGPRLIDDGITTLAGRQPVNPSGGLCSRGHPVGATGLLQIAELVWQMRGEAGAHQIASPPKVTMAQNQGGLLLGQDSAAYSTTILSV
ncbi:thiolase family protein [Mesorhizobium sp.]|uniref:thiolase family protein n=1 Tax=Mesorhizobium sp. TaxID=1871066 RepID=UPI0025F8E4FF|nr:thiolase family protein [Mesorhizobium sp.]